jgi:hypothetical protein
MAKTLSYTFDQIEAALKQSTENIVKSLSVFIYILNELGNTDKSDDIKQTFTLCGFTFDDLYNYLTTENHTLYCQTTGVQSAISINISETTLNYSCIYYNDTGANENGSILFNGTITRDSSDSNYKLRVQRTDLNLSRNVPSLVGLSSQEEIQEWLTSNFKDADDLKNACKSNLYMLYNGVYTPLYLSTNTAGTVLQICYHRYTSVYDYGTIIYCVLQSGTLNITSFLYKNGICDITINIDNSILVYNTGDSYENMNGWLSDIFGTYDESVIMSAYDGTRFTINDSAGRLTECLTFWGESVGGDNVKWTIAFFDSGINKIYSEVITYNPTSGTITVEKTSI